MKQAVVDEVLARKFLLRDLSSAEQFAVEEQAFLDPDSFWLLQAAEDDLIDEYVSGDLTAEETELFEKHFISRPGRAADLRIARALQKYVSQETAASADSGTSVTGAFLPGWLNISSPAPRVSLAALALLLAVAGIWLAIRIFRDDPRPPVRATQEKFPNAPPPTNTPSETPAPVNSRSVEDNHNRPPLTPKQPASPIFSLNLFPTASVRGGGDVKILRLPSGSSIARLQLTLFDERPYRSYQASLQTDEGKRIRSWTILSATVSKAGKEIQINVPGRLLDGQQRYRVMVRGIARGGKIGDFVNYYFEVEK
jgi:hypothetical protein